MEQLVIISLLIIIVIILLQKKLSRRKDKEEKKHTQLNLPSIIGDTKKEERQSVPLYADQRQSENNKMGVPIFEPETNSQGLDNNNRKKNLDEILVRSEAWEEEEEDWLDEMEIEVESGFATGVTFQELNAASQFFQHDVLDPDIENEAAYIIQKIQGTELFNLLEKSLGEASRRVDNLLSKNYQNDGTPISSDPHKGFDGFDIGEFV
ncbi:hypothetical protein EG359_06320 [Chryseobacterium joostei]|uniref:Conjugal transfer protein TraD n=1 Tax=Chryseobacterium joostei TaxID=112234 RepID=A0A1N7HSX4_9FLAO|nr:MULTISPECIES: hypothetical protein [Chryseobacterium]AZA77056.1 hypothetical protein EG347_05825 [Chryseobacterium sp. G0186]AZA99242.1 hypothetical protein EG359_06320 [Chryseobacterium joostei]SIS27830.1 hypothetical protein SAMN05421768_10192 [Chryseobacterium joostei]